MLSYIHAYHCGNSGDILKHLVFSFVLEHLCLKEKPFTVIDSHAGSGLYHLDDERIIKTAEAQDGILSLLNKLNSSQDKNSILNESTYIKIAKIYAKKNLYPGSPEIAKNFLRAQDKLIVNELHPQVVLELKENVKQKALFKSEGSSITVYNKHAAEFLKAVIPPKIKRGCVIIDPSYEDRDEYTQTAAFFTDAYKKWQVATYLIWYPLLLNRESEVLQLKEYVESAVELSGASVEEKLNIFELKTKDPSQMTGLSQMYGSGVIVVNPTYQLKEKMQQILSEPPAGAGA